MKLLAIALMCLGLQACAVVAVADAAASTVVFGVKTAVNVVDAITPDIVNKKK